ncbi:MAG: ATP-binding protein [Thermomicrobiales bacterium]
MSAGQFLQAVTQIVFVLISLVVTRAAVRQPTAARIDIAGFFGVTTFIILESWLVAAFGVTSTPLLTIFITALLMVLPYLLIRLVNDFTTVPTLIMRGAEAGLFLAIVAIIAFSPTLPSPILVFLVLYFVAGNAYVAIAFLHAAGDAGGVTRRRLYAVAAGSGFLGLAILIAGVSTFLPVAARGVTQALQQVAGLACVLSYFLGFAPPPLVRRAWQEPELRTFLSQAARLPRLPDTAAIVRELEHGAQQALGAQRAAIGLWDEDTGALRYTGANGPLSFAADQFIGGRAFTSQQPIFSRNAPRDDPEHAALYRNANATAVLAAPITAGQQRLGVLSVFAARPPIFADEDLYLLRLLADQGAVILESRALIDEATRVQAREEAARLKDDFLSAAAHDLKTPLTTLIATAQLLQRRAERRPDEPADLGAIQRIVNEAVRLRTIVIELLDAARADQNSLLGRREPVDLAELAQAVVARHTSAYHQIIVDAPEPVVGRYDRMRVTQLLENLVENAIKYSPDGGEVHIRVWGDNDQATLTVRDPGIGIPAADLPHLFERFHRGTNVDDRQFAGMGLGLYICRSIVEEHGGEIHASSKPGQGSTFQVTLPRQFAPDAAPEQEAVSVQLGTEHHR